MFWNIVGRRERRPLRIAVASFDDRTFPCARIRLLDPLARCGKRVEVRHALRHSPGGWTFDEATVDWAHLVVVQRGVPRSDTEALCNRILSSAVPVVYETDDCLPEIPPYHQKDHYRENAPFVLGFAARAAMVTVSTEALRQYFQPHNPRTVVLPNYLNEELWTDDLAPRSTSVRRGIRLGYVGNRGHRGDLAIVAQVLRRLQREHADLRLVFLGCAPDGFEESAKCTILAPNFDYASFPRRLAALDLDIAIAPLLDNPFNRCISNLKFLEYGFLGVPAVYSDAEAYRGSVEHGSSGLLCGNSESEWYAALNALVRDAAARSAMGRAAQRAVRESWMLKPHADRWLEAYAALLPNAASAA